MKIFNVFKSAVFIGHLCPRLLYNHNENAMDILTLPHLVFSPSFSLLVLWFSRNSFPILRATPFSVMWITSTLSQFGTLRTTLATRLWWLKRTNVAVV